SQGARWFKVISGAYANRADADSLLAALRRRKVLDAGSGAVTRLPFAFLIESSVPAAAVSGMLANYADRGQPVYALRQTDGTEWLRQVERLRCRALGARRAARAPAARRKDGGGHLSGVLCPPGRERCRSLIALLERRRHAARRVPGSGDHTATVAVR